jgi:hypothetical protein
MPLMASPAVPVTRTVCCPVGLIRSSSGGWWLKKPSIETVSDRSGPSAMLSGCWPVA